MDRVAVDPGVVRVVSTVPGRIRLQGDPLRQSDLAGVTEELREWPEIDAVDLRARSASIVVRFDPGHLALIADRLMRLGIEPGAGVLRRPPSAAAAITNAAKAGNGLLGRRLGGTDARVLLPLGLGLLAARRAMRGRERLAEAPWYVLAWYASETFWKFHGGTAGADDQLADSRGK